MLLPGCMSCFQSRKLPLKWCGMGCCVPLSLLSAGDVRRNKSLSVSAQTADVPELIPIVLTQPRCPTPKPMLVSMVMRCTFLCQVPYTGKRGWVMPALIKPYCFQLGRDNSMKKSGVLNSKSREEVSLFENVFSCSLSLALQIVNKSECLGMSGHHFPSS